METRKGTTKLTSNDICRFDEEEISHRSLESLPKEPRQLTGKEASEVVKRFWPRNKELKWTQRCVSFLGNSLLTVGQRLPSTDTHSKDAIQLNSSRDALGEESRKTKHKKRALATYLQQNAKDVRDFLQDSDFTMSNPRNLQKFITDLKNFEEFIRRGNGKKMKSKKKKTEHSKVEGMDSSNSNGKSKTINNNNNVISLQAYKLEIQKPEKSKNCTVKVKDLIDAGLLNPGTDIVTVSYKGTTYHGSLDKNGNILFQDMTFTSPSAFSVHVKRLLTPNKQGDDGWSSVIISGKSLNIWRTQYLDNLARAASRGDKPIIFYVGVKRDLE